MASRLKLDKEKSKAWREKNREHIREYFKAYYEKKKSEISERRKNRYHNDPEYKAKCLAQAKAFAAKKNNP